MRCGPPLNRAPPPPEAHELAVEPERIFVDALRAALALADETAMKIVEVLLIKSHASRSSFQLAVAVDRLSDPPTRGHAVKNVTVERRQFTVPIDDFEDLVKVASA